MRSRSQRVLVALIAVAIAALTLVYRFNTLGGPLAGFDNDHFFQIVRAEAMLDGELPLRDFADNELRSLWPPLTYATSAAAMRVMGRTLRSEALVSVALLSLGAALLFVIAAVVCGSIANAALVTLIGVALGPTLYNHPKIVPYALAVAAMLAYGRHPTTWRLLALTATVVVATLYRHDHAAYLGIASAVLIVLLHRRRAARPLATAAAFAVVGLLPGLLYVQTHIGIVHYLRECLTMSSREANRTTAPAQPLTIDWSQPLIARATAPAPPAPRFAVRWVDALTPAERVEAERHLELLDPQPRGDERNWSYSGAAASTSQLKAIVTDPRVADTDGIDRRAFVLTAPPAPARPGGIFQWRLAPGLLREENAGPWLRAVAWSVTLLTLVLTAWPRVRHAVERPGVPAPFIAAVAVLGVLLCVVFLRNPATYRLPDVAVPMTVLGAWLPMAIRRGVRGLTPVIRVAVATLLMLILVVTVVAAGTVGAVPNQIRTTGAAAGLDGISNRWRDLWSILGSLPESSAGIDPTLAAAAAYLQRCTQPSDRVLIAEYVPELHYFSRRGVAAGQMVFFGGFYTSQESQRRTLVRWEQQRQSVPIALVQTADRFDDEFGSDYPELARYLREHYRRAGTLDVRQGLSVDVWVEARRQPVTDAATQLPCFIR